MDWFLWFVCTHAFSSFSGIDASIIFLDHPNSIDGEIVMINPRIINRSRELDMKVWTEECLVLPPTFRATLLRDAVVTVEYQNFDGDFRQITLDGELARAFQHELDHDRGVLIVDHIGLDEMDPRMRFIEHIDHDQKMEKAFTRFISDPFETS
jgi:peptide deformylase